MPYLADDVPYASVRSVIELGQTEAIALLVRSW